MTGLLIFALTYLLIAVRRLPFVRLNRPAAGLLGVVAMVVFGVLLLSDAYAAIDFDVIVFLLGLMLIVGYLEVGKVFEWAAEWVLRRAVTPHRLMLVVVSAAMATLSNLISNVPAVTLWRNTRVFGVAVLVIAP